MSASAGKDYLVVVQCHIVKERCSGYHCEKAFHERSGGFAAYPAERGYRTLYLTCGGCCGRALQRKLTHLAASLEKEEGVPRDRIAVHLSTCITKESYHGPACPHLDLLKALIRRARLDAMEDTYISATAEGRRRSGSCAP